MLRLPVESRQYTSWIFGHRLREAGLLGSMGRVASSVDNALIESFFSTLQRELLDTRRWPDRTALAAAIFEWIEAWSRYAGDPLLGRWGRGGRVASSIGGPWWGSPRACFAPLGPAAVS